VKNEFLSAEVFLFEIHEVRVAAVDHEYVKIDCREEERRTDQVYTPLLSLDNTRHLNYHVGI